MQCSAFDVRIRSRYQRMVQCGASVALNHNSNARCWNGLARGPVVGVLRVEVGHAWTTH